MRTFKRLVVVGFLALVGGATLGFLHDDLSQLSSSQFIKPASLPRDMPEGLGKTNAQFEAKEIECLAEIVFREARSESIGVQRLIAMTVIARRDDPDRQWPKTICGILGQRGAISQADRQLDLNARGVATLSRTLALAEDVYDSAWKTQFLPGGWECVRYWRVSDKQLASLKAKHLKQLGISQARTGLNFFDKLEPVPSPPGTITFFYDPNRCVKPLPTT